MPLTNNPFLDDAAAQRVKDHAWLRDDEHTVLGDGYAVLDIYPTSDHAKYNAVNHLNHGYENITIVPTTQAHRDQRLKHLTACLDWEIAAGAYS